MYDLTILTPCLNARDGLARTLASVDRLVATGVKVQHLILDAGSTDGSSFLLAEPPVWRNVRIRPDRGPFDALLSANSLIRGQYVQVLNAGDTFVRRNSGELGEILRNPHAADILTFGALVARSRRASALHDIGMLRFNSAGRHEAVLIRRALIRETGFDPRYRICADRDQLLTMLRRGATLEASDCDLVAVDPEGISTHRIWRKEWENIQISFRHFGAGEILLRTMGFSLARLAAKLLARALRLDWVSSKYRFQQAIRPITQRFPGA